MSHLPHTYSYRCRPVYCLKVKCQDLYVSDFDICEKYYLLGKQPFARLIGSSYRYARRTADYLSRLSGKKIIVKRIGWREEYFTFIPSSYPDDFRRL